MKTIARFLLLLLYTAGAFATLAVVVIDFRALNWFWWFPEVLTLIALVLLIRNGLEGAPLKQIATGGAWLAGFWAVLWWIIRPAAENIMTVIINLPWLVPALWHNLLQLPWWAIVLIFILGPTILGLVFRWLVVFPIIVMVGMASATIGSVWERKK